MMSKKRSCSPANQAEAQNSKQKREAAKPSSPEDQRGKSTLAWVRRNDTASLLYPLPHQKGEKKRKAGSGQDAMSSVGQLAIPSKKRGLLPRPSERPRNVQFRESPQQQKEVQLR